MTAISEGRARWLAECVLPHEPRLRSWLARHRVVDLDVDDIVQEAYAVLAELQNVDHIRNPRNYLYSVAHSILLQHVRRQRIVSIEAMADLEHLGLYSDEPTPDEALSDFQELREIAQLLAGLPRRCREAFTLRKIEGLSQREIAGRMHIAESTVEKHISKALNLLSIAMRGPAMADAQKPARAPATPQRKSIERQSDE
jgi:RNA polymerase sigma-70 factor (ECF subfamily)